MTLKRKATSVAITDIPSLKRQRLFNPTPFPDATQGPTSPTPSIDAIFTEIPNQDIYKSCDGDDLTCWFESSNEARIEVFNSKMKKLDVLLLTNDWKRILQTIGRIIQFGDRIWEMQWAKRGSLLMIQASAFYHLERYQQCENCLQQVARSSSSSRTKHLEDQVYYYLFAKCLLKLGKIRKAKGRLLKAMEVCEDGKLGKDVGEKLSDLLDLITDVEMSGGLMFGTSQPFLSIKPDPAIHSSRFCLRITKSLSECSQLPTNYASSIMAKFGIYIFDNKLYCPSRKSYTEALKYAILISDKEEWLLDILTQDSRFKSITWDHKFRFGGRMAKWCTNTLTFAAYYNRHAAIQHLIRKGVSTEPTSTGHTCYHFALLNYQLTTIQLLWKEVNVDLNAQDHLLGLTALHLAVMEVKGKDCVRLCQALLAMGEGLELRTSRIFGTPIDAALSCGNVHAVKFFHQLGINFDVRGADGLNYVQRAAKNGRIKDILTLVSVAKADLNYYADHPLEFEMNDNKDNYRESTALHIAAIHNKLEAVFALIHLGADINARDREGRTFLHHLASRTFEHDTYQPSSGLGYFIEKGADIDARTCLGMTPLFYALNYGSADMVDALSKAGATMKAVDHDKHSILPHTITLELEGGLKNED